MLLVQNHIYSLEHFQKHFLIALQTTCKRLQKSIGLSIYYYYYEGLLLVFFSCFSCNIFSLIFYYRKYFRKHRFVGIFEYRTPKLLILDPVLVNDIFVKYFKNFGENTLCEAVSFLKRTTKNRFTLIVILLICYFQYKLSDRR